MKSYKRFFLALFFSGIFNFSPCHAQIKSIREAIIFVKALEATSYLSTTLGKVDGGLTWATRALLSNLGKEKGVYIAEKNLVVVKEMDRYSLSGLLYGERKFSNEEIIEIFKDSKLTVYHVDDYGAFQQVFFNFNRDAWAAFQMLNEF